MIDEELLQFKISIILVLKGLRKAKVVSQANLNTDILERTGFTHNMGRSEVEGNFTMETLYLYCKYFSIRPVDFFQKVNDVSLEDIQNFIKEKQEKQEKKRKDA